MTTFGRNWQRNCPRVCQVRVLPFTWSVFSRPSMSLKPCAKISQSKRSNDCSIEPQRYNTKDHLLMDDSLLIFCVIAAFVWVKYRKTRNLGKVKWWPTKTTTDISAHAAVTTFLSNFIVGTAGTYRIGGKLHRTRRSYSA